MDPPRPPQPPLSSTAPSSVADALPLPEQQHDAEQHQRHQRRRRRHRHHRPDHDGHPEHGDDAAAFSGSSGEEDSGHGLRDGDGVRDGSSPSSSFPPRPATPPLEPQAPPRMQPPASPPLPLEPLRPLRIDSPKAVLRARDSGSLTPGRSPSRRRQERRIKAAASKAGRMRKRVVVAIFLIGALVGAYFIPRWFPRIYVLPLLPALNISAVLDPTISSINSTILNDVWGLFQSALSPDSYPGLVAKEQGLRAHYPLVLIPGFITTGLEVWEGEQCASSLFRSRLWGTLTMLSTMMMQPACWAKHMALDPATGLDPPGIRIRPAQGLEAADNFLGSFFWVWSRLIQDFAAIGYDHKNLFMASYDWRLSLHDMERRDAYFTILKSRIETLVKINGQRKVVLIAHSYGSNVLLYFFKWVEARRGGNGGHQWVENHVHAFVNIAGPLAGVIKAAAAFTSGEMHDTAELGPLEGILFGKDTNAFHRLNRRRLFRTWGSLAAMLPKGGVALWGNQTHAPDDVAGAAGGGGEAADDSCLPELEDGAFVVKPGAGAGADSAAAARRPAEGDEAPGETPRSSAAGACVTPGERRAEPIRYGQVIGFAQPPPPGQGQGQEQQAPGNWTVQDVMDHLQNDPDDAHLRRRLQEDFDFGYVADPRKLSPRAQEDPRLWTNPLAISLPKAPKMKVLCFYGVGKPTERAYIYKADGAGRLDVIDTSVSDASRNVSDGVLMGEGDGTVSLLSLGYHCAKLWREPSHNPSGMSVTSRELWHTTTGLSTLTRTGGASGDHVDVLGNTEMAAELLRLVSGDDSIVGQDRYYSRICEMAEKVKLT